MTAMAAARRASPPDRWLGSDRDSILLSVPSEAHTLAGFRKWVLSGEVPEKLPLTFLKGEVFIDMSMEEIQSHSLVKTEVGRILANLDEAIDFGHIFINGVLISNIAAEVSNNPDLVAVSFASLEAGRVRYRKHKDRIVEIVGSPDIVAEIVSDSSISKDTRDLREAYHKAHIPEYWLIDARGQDISFQILHWRKTGYGSAKIEDVWQKSRVLRRSFRLTRKRDRAGTWKYQLATRVLR